VKYWAFISYSHRDEPWARWLHRAIETYRVPDRLVGKTTRDGIVPKRLFPVFRDRDELPASSDLSISIVDALKQSRFLIVICSRGAAASRWVNEEIKTFKALAGEDRVLCLVVDGEPNASDNPAFAQHECFPPAVRYRVSNEGSLEQERAEPLAADARPRKDGRSAAKLKLLSGLLGIGLDELKLRERERRRAGQRLSFSFAAVFGALLLLPNGPLPLLRSFAFDKYQVLMPRTPTSAPATVVEIDDRSLHALGQWPWPRTLLAKLVTTISQDQPAAVALNILMPDPDRLSPPDRTNPLSESKTNDIEFARAVAGSRAILAVVGAAESTGQPVRGPPFRIRDSAAASTPAEREAAVERLYRYEGAWSSLDEFDRVAAGRGLISVPLASDGLIRQIPLVATIDGTLVPALAIEMLRVALDASSLVLLVSGNSVQGVAVGEMIIPTGEDGAVRIHYSTGNSEGSVSAIDVLDGKVDPRWLRKKLVLIGVTAVGTEPVLVVPGGRPMRGTEIHRELLENIYEGTLLSRPAWARYIEASLFCLVAVLFTIGVPRWSAALSCLTLIACCTIVTIAGVLAFSWGRMLFDPAHVILGVVVLFGLIMSYGFFSTRT